MAGTVHLVGAGPGDRDLLTRRAARLLGEATVAVADREGTAGAMELVPPGAERLYVDGTATAPEWPLDRVVELVAARAASERAVLRVVAGDVFVASRAAEEVAALRARGLDVTITPGVSAATAAPLASGMVPVPGTAVNFASGDDGPGAVPVDWGAFDEPGSTLVVLDGHARHGEIAERLVAAGIGRATPVVVVRNAGRGHPEVTSTDLAGLGVLRVSPPSTLVIGPMRRGVRERP